MKKHQMKMFAKSYADVETSCENVCKISFCRTWEKNAGKICAFLPTLSLYRHNVPLFIHISFIDLSVYAHAIPSINMLFYLLFL